MNFCNWAQRRVVGSGFPELSGQSSQRALGSGRNSFSKDKGEIDSGRFLKSKSDLYPQPPPSSFHTHIHTNIHKHTHAHTLEYTHTHSHINMLTHKYSHTYTHNNMERYAQILFCVCFSEGEEKVQTAKQGSTTLGNRGQRISSYPC